MKKLFNRLPATPSKWVYWFFRLHYTRLLVEAMLDAQYPGIELRRRGKPFGTVVAMTDLHYVYIDERNYLHSIRQRCLNAYRYSEYKDKSERLALWQESEALKKIMDGLRQIKRNGIGSNYELHKPDGTMEYISGFGLLCIPIYQVLDVKKYLWVAATCRMFECQAFLPSQVRLRPISVTQRK